MNPSRLLVSAGTFLLLLALLGCSSQSNFARTERLEQSGNYAGALAIYQKLIDQIPARNTRARSQVYFRMGECLYRLDRIAEAFTAVQKAADIEPGNMAAQLRLGEFFLAGGATERAREQADMVLKKAGDDTEALALWAGALAASGKTDAAKVSTGLAKGRHLTSYHTIRDDMINAGANWEDREVIVDRNLVTSRQPSDIPAFNREMIQLFSQSRGRNSRAA